ncbi:glycosyltransferase [Arhodomonas aquaeolei]|uniref:glycosyltransferase n=1 Tax=Arhodomonas aquaeolei TaxID=2369 RepID=UPI00216880D8|nr:glycosyltransferase [Arhodomonas aquaeolei]MCS4505808.1 glycosyltransferase [Arhodomonas aquaeolei]
MTGNAAVRVVHVASGDLWAGAEVQVYGLVTAQRRAGMDARAVLFNDGTLYRRLRSDGVPVTLLDETRLGAPRLLAALWRSLRRARPAVVHTHRRKEHVLGALAARAAGVPVSLRTVHGADESAPPAAWQFHRRIAAGLDAWCGRRLQKATVAVSGELAGRLAAHSGGRPPRVVENGIDAAAVRAAAAAPVALPGPADAFRVALVGRLVPVKAPERFVAAVAALPVAAAGQPVHGYVIGDGPLTAAVTDVAARAGVADRLHVMGFRDDVPACLRRMDALMVTSEHEGMPTNVLEALVLGVPVIAHAVGGLPAVLGEGRYGVLVRDPDPAAFAAALSTLAAEGGAARRRAVAASGRAAVRYDFARVAAGYARIYSELLREAQPASAATEVREP